MRTILTAMLALLVIGGATACQETKKKSAKDKTAQKAQPGQSPADLSTPLAKVDDVVITVGELQERLNRQSPYIRARYTSLEQKKEFLDSLIRFEVLAKEAERRGFDKDPEVIRTMKQVMIQKLMKDEFEVRVTPDWPAAKRYIIENLHYDLKARVIFQSRTKFWKRDGVSPNIIFGEQELADTWAMAEDVPTSRGLLIGQARTSLAENSFAKFRALYPGKSQDIEQAMLVNWTLDPYAGTCLPLGWTPGETAKFWPELIRPYGRIHFASVATHCFPNGLEAGVRAAKVTAEAIDRG